MKKPITIKQVLHQLKADLIGKDSYRGVTLTYSWLANQFGHFSLGFVPSLVTYAILTRFTQIHNPAFWAALIISIAWLLFELYNFLGPLLLNKHSKSKLLFVIGKKYTFQPPWGNIAFDTFTDLCFFWFGGFSASLFLHFSWCTIFILIILFLILIYPSSYWFLTKMYLQAAQYPFQFRLSQWDVDIDDIDKSKVYQFLGNNSDGKHLFVFGGRRSGKTSISVGIGTELSIKHKSSFYTTGMKLYSMFFESDSKILSDDNALWTWRTASVMIIDDINPGNPITNEIVTPKMFLSMLDNYTSRNDENRRAVKEKNTIWVLGDKDRDNQSFLKWKEILKQIGVDENNILAINLQSSYLP